MKQDPVLRQYIADRSGTYDRNGKRISDENQQLPFITDGDLSTSVTGWGWTLALILATLAVIVGTYAICICILWPAIQNAANF
jgi:hypothetical protein